MDHTVWCWLDMISVSVAPHCDSHQQIVWRLRGPANALPQKFAELRDSVAMVSG